MYRIVTNFQICYLPSTNLVKDDDDDDLLGDSHRILTGWENR